MGIYSAAVNEMSGWPFSKLLFGAGTSSAGGVKADFDPEFGGTLLDANRSMHNEFLRAFYEWGIIGLGLMVAFLASLLGDLGGFARFCRTVPKISMLSFFPTLMCSLAIENILSNSGAPAGTAIVLLIAYAMTKASVPGTEPLIAGSNVPRLTGTANLSDVAASFS